MRWPVEQARRDELQREGRPRLLLLEDGVAPPPAGPDDLEDWIRVPAGEVDLRARVEGLRRRAEARVDPAPALDDDGVLRLGDRWVSLPPVEARLTAALLDRYGAVVSRDALARAGWPAGAPGPQRPRRAHAPAAAPALAAGAGHPHRAVARLPARARRRRSTPTPDAPEQRRAQVAWSSSAEVADRHAGDGVERCTRSVRARAVEADRADEVTVAHHDEVPLLDRAVVGLHLDDEREGVVGQHAEVEGLGA